MEQVQKTILSSFQEYMERQICEILGEFNMWLAGEKLGHPPTKEEAVMHYILYGGAKNFAERYSYKEKI